MLIVIVFKRQDNRKFSFSSWGCSIFSSVWMVNITFVVSNQMPWIFFLKCSLALSPSLECNLDSLQPPHLLGSSDSPVSPSQVAGITGTHHHARLIFVFLVEMGFHHVVQDDLDLLTSWSTCLDLPKCWDYRCEPPHPARNAFTLLVGV